MLSNHSGAGSSSFYQDSKISLPKCVSASLTSLTFFNSNAWPERLYFHFASA